MVEKNSYDVPPIFAMLAREGQIEEQMMYNTFNMGVGMSVVVAAEDVDKALQVLRANGEDAYIIGSIVESEDKVQIC